MKFLSLVVALVVSIHCCAAQTNNRSSLWLLANSQIFAYNSRVPQTCFVSVTGLGPSSSITLLSTSNLLITGTFAQLANSDTTTPLFVTSQSVLRAVTIQFIYNSTYSITLAIPVQGTTATPTALTIANLFAVPQPTTPYWTSTVGSSSTNSYPIVFGINSIMSPTGSTWLSVQNIPSIFTATATQTSAGPPEVVSPASSGIIITDYISSSTIAVTLWNDNNLASALTTGSYNAFYQLGVRTKSSLLTSTSSVLLNAGTCNTVTGRKRSVDHLINKRDTLSTCTTTSIDPSMTSSVLTTLCSTITAVHNALAGTASLTISNLVDASNKGIIAQNALYQADFAVFGAGSSKFAIASNFGMLIAMSSIIFSFLN